ncbi:Piso0_005553 [Millerozyma farinosa CBS 7064]|uniref:SWI5-dependent HO expression protein 3 n=1 Tax=Pichia sorbitophila (strain ATCC MYA-4447 / BCRC 22081 / CBS 7064 / NBRC 10061 / NRRL Y-12695) TaxID=559304 RepID=G8Y2A2_PICSO|nr:Piso0_005553 [Millerozyma farinosa CBS 7064]
MEESSPVKNKGTSRVIDLLHSEIDSLKKELEDLKVVNDEYKKKNTVLNKKNESNVDQLANAKHENDMIHALLKRKERRIFDLEEQYNELSTANESLALNNKNMKIRCDNLQESSSASIAEYERLKIAYDALMASQVEYKKHYEKELISLSASLEAYKKESLERFNALQSSMSCNEKDVDTLLDSLTSKTKTVENLYSNKNKAVIDLLSRLAKVARLHGQESKSVLENSINNIKALVEKYPDLGDKLSVCEQSEIDIETLINESQETLSNSTLDEEATLVNSPDPQNDSKSNKNNALLIKKRKNKRNSMRIDGKSNQDNHVLQQLNFNSKKNAGSWKQANKDAFGLDVKPTLSAHSDSSDVSSENFKSSRSGSGKTNSRNSSNKSKRRSMYATNSNQAHKSGKHNNTNELQV